MFKSFQDMGIPSGYGFKQLHFQPWLATTGVLSAGTSSTLIRGNIKKLVPQMTSRLKSLRLHIRQSRFLRRAPCSTLTVDAQGKAAA